MARIEQKPPEANRHMTEQDYMGYSDYGWLEYTGQIAGMIPNYKYDDWDRYINKKTNRKE